MMEEISKNLETLGHFVSCIPIPSPSNSYPSNMVRLITHNMLACHVSTSHAFTPHPLIIATLHNSHFSPLPPLFFFPENCTKDNFPLVFSEVELVERPAPINPDFIKRFLPKLDWKALVDTARSVSMSMGW